MRAQPLISRKILECTRRGSSACCFSSATIQRGLEDDLAANSHCAVSTVLQRGIHKICAVVCGDVLVGDGVSKFWL